MGNSKSVGSNSMGVRFPLPAPSKILPLWMAKHPNNAARLVPILPLWKPEPITLCALFSGSSRLTPKVEGLLDFLAEYIGTDRDPRVKQGRAKEYFTDLTLSPTSGP